MRAVVQVASTAHVEVGGEITGRLDSPGLVILLGVTHDDDQATARKVAQKIWQLRILEDETSAASINAPLLVISQFTLYGSVRKGRRPSWSNAAPGPVSEPLYEYFVAYLRELGASVQTGVFGAMMNVSLTNTGPFTMIVDSADLP
ncbi:MAG TPA: D-tyrosyl-tRNA(Tyr) deacylase [Glutamicibacter sp.]|uniref:D-aminoacyl-tRNA deacylase n=1 Tax=Glutamicibacter arilaitensis (strain DSM 16368 / CIP 108037 / IAM 15318 / JCM 13566 / NCIMB 14258 / Re117) TaxID=861360 RepID=A0ABP1U2P5_GLUAR|nr:MULTISPECIES: D-aminoacyl-tRNA deacylase [Glutamicibacter]CBT75949.1 D-tyrosyl-tRNA(Tyr) deacylase [Glutamicibacter arilaitensis Re117]HCH46994.1 D-tyrosyl-tRNA(Tyr) deacylase [Glutamicibacter sp.]HCM94056.1 D-tyrosyl-tRNA(Tyr) deacylase [Glutamicibacter sp.]